MPAQTKSELLDVTRREFAKLDSALDGVRRGEPLVKDDDGVSIKDVVAHRAHWLELFFGWYADGRAERPVHFPAEGYKWTELDAYNAALRRTQRRLGWAKARADLRGAHERLIAFVSARTEAELYGAPMKGANNAWTTGRWAEAAGPSHYRSATKYVRARLRALRGTG